MIDSVGCQVDLNLMPTEFLNQMPTNFYRTHQSYVLLHFLKHEYPDVDLVVIREFMHLCLPLCERNRGDMDNRAGIQCFYTFIYILI